MSFTDIFIKRPVLATVVSLLILLIGAQAGFKLPIRQYPGAVQHHDHRHHRLSRRQCRPDQGLHHHADPAGGGERRGHRHADVSSSPQNVSTVTLNLRLDADPDRAMADVLSKVEQVKSILPREAEGLRSSPSRPARATR